MSKIEKKLDEWLEHGLLSSDQHQKIIAYEDNSPVGERSWAAMKVWILGALIIGLGIISVIAANWNNIPDFLKLTIDFLLLFVLAGATVRAKENQNEFQFESFLVLFMVLCLASIGLISQIFHTGGELYQALLFWSLITLPAALAARYRFTAFLWTGTFLSSLAFYLVESKLIEFIFNKNPAAVVSALTLACVLITVLLKTTIGEVAFTKSFRYWSGLGVIISIVLFETIKPSVYAYYSNRENFNFESYIATDALALLVAISIWSNSEYRQMQKTLLLTGLAFFIFEAHLPLLGIVEPIFYALVTLITLSCGAIFFASISEKKIFAQFLNLIGIRFLILYFQALGGLAATGFGLIISGVLIITGANYWRKNKKQFMAWIERSTQ